MRLFAEEFLAELLGDDGAGEDYEDEGDCDEWAFDGVSKDSNDDSPFGEGLDSFVTHGLHPYSVGVVPLDVFILVKGVGLCKSWGLGSNGIERNLGDEEVCRVPGVAFLPYRGDS